GIEHFGKAVGAGICDVRRCGAGRVPIARSDSLRSHDLGWRLEGNDGRYRGEHKDAEGSGDESEHRHLYFFLLDLFADVFRRSADHQAGNEYGENRVEKNAVKTGTGTAENHLAGFDIE